MANFNRINIFNYKKLSLSKPLIRYAQNPILTPNQINAVWSKPEWQVVTVHNAGVTTLGDETIMLFRSHLRCGISVLGLAKSKNGVDDWKIHPQPVLKPATGNDDFAPGTDSGQLIENESGGVEDPRIMKFGAEYAITYSAYHGKIKNRVRVSLAMTTDFINFVRYGPVLERDMRNVVFFTEKINGKYVGLFRPNDVTEGDVGGQYTQIRIGYSDDWRSNSWNIAPEPIMHTGFGPSAFSDKIGPGAPPIKTDKGWLNIFHGVRTTMDGNPYVLGVALHSLKNPARVKISAIPLLFPSRADCRVPEDGYVHVPNVVFSCGVTRKNDGSLWIYYGGNDTVMNLAFSHEKILIELCEKFGRDPLTGNLLYSF
ncbi:MAG: glycosidase [Calditrichaeota bacterium]|nr:glycosidase [Calditrichota bacterium]